MVGGSTAEGVPGVGEEVVEVAKAAAAEGEKAEVGLKGNWGFEVVGGWLGSFDAGWEAWKGPRGWGGFSWREEEWAEGVVVVVVVWRLLPAWLLKGCCGMFGGGPIMNI